MSKGSVKKNFRFLAGMLSSVLILQNICTVPAWAQEQEVSQPESLDEADSEGGLVYDEAAASADMGDASYVGSIPNTNLGVYRLDVDESAQVADSVDSGDDQEIQEAVQAIYDAAFMTMDEAFVFLEEADARACGTDNDAFDENALSKVQILDSYSNDSSARVLVVDDDAVVVLVEDENGQGIPDAVVTINYVNESGNRESRSVITDGEAGTEGVAVFADMQGSRYGAVDVQHENYESQTVMDVNLSGGENIIRCLKEKEENQCYVRCADMGGADLLYGDVSIALMKSGTEDLNLSFLISSTGDAKLPEQLELRAKNGEDDRLVTALSKTSSIYSGADTAAYALSADWIQAEGLLKNGDKLYVKMGSDTEETETDEDGWEWKSEKKLNVKVEDAKVTTPTWTNTPFGFFNGLASFKLPDYIPGAGGGKVGVDLFKTNVSAAVLPDGSFFVSYGENLIDPKEMKEIMNQSWIPRQSERVKGVFDKIRSNIRSKIDAFQQGKSIFSGQGFSVAPDVSYSFTFQLIGGCVGRYDFDTGVLKGDFTVALSVKGAFGLTIYIITPVGPFYGGAQASFGGTAAGSIGLTVNPTGKDTDIFDNISVTPPGSQAGLTFDLIGTIGGYVGAGIHELACAQIDGSVYMDASVRYKKDSGTDIPLEEKKIPHIYITGGYEVDISATVLFFKYHKKIESLSDRGVFYDSWDENDAANGYSDDELQETAVPISVDMDHAQSELTCVDDFSYTINSGMAVNDVNGQDITRIDSLTLADNKACFVKTSNQTALFRIMAIGGIPRLVYQIQDKTSGQLENTVHLVETPTEGKAVYAYDVRANQTDYGNSQYEDNVYLCVIGGEFIEDDTPEERAMKTNVSAMTINLSSGEVRQSVAVRDGDDMQHLDAQAAGSGDTCAVAWRESASYLSSDRKPANAYIYSPWIKDDTKIKSHGRMRQLLTTGVLKEGESAFFKGWRDGTYVRYYGIDGYGEYVEDDVMMIENPNGEYTDIPPISDFVYANGKCYGIVGGILCYMERKKSESGSWLEWKRISADREGNPVTWPDDDNASYRFVYDNSAGLSVASLAKHYKEDNTLDYSLLTVYKVGSYSDETAICGAQEIELEGVNAGNYTIARQDEGGYQLVYSDGREVKESGNEVSDTVQLFMWKQNQERKLEAVDFSLDSPAIRRTQKSLGATIFIKNTGCQYEDIVKFKITDKDGNVLQLLDSEGNPQSQEDDGSYGYWSDIYPGETESFRVTIQPNPSWESGAQELNVCVTYPVTNALIDLTVSYDMPSIYMNGYQTTLNGKNTAFLNLKNHSIVPAENLSLVLTGNFQKNNDNSANDGVLMEIPLDIGSLSDTRENVSDLGQNYCLRLDLEDIWNQYKDSDRLLYGITVSLLTEGDDENSVTEELYFDNPYLPALYMIHAVANDPTFGTIDGGGAYQFGETATLTAFPENGYRFVCWQDESGEEVSTDESYSIDVEDQSREFMAVFEPDGSVHSLVVNAGPNPLVETEEPGGAVYVDGCDRTVFDGKNTIYRVNDQDTVTLTAKVTGEGLCFGGWIDDSGELVSEERIMSVTVTEDMEFTAVFEEMPDPDLDEPVEPESDETTSDHPEGDYPESNHPESNHPESNHPGTGSNESGQNNLKTASNAKTGDKAPLMVMFFLMIAGAGICIIFLGKKLLYKDDHKI